MFGAMKLDLQRELASIRDAGLHKSERQILSPQSAHIRVRASEQSAPRDVLNFCANNYLGLSSHPKVIEAAQEALRTHGYGMSSVRFICGTQDIHRELEHRISRFLGTDDAILYAACFDANGGLFEPLLGEQDAIITDQLNHASIVDGIRLCKATRLIYRNTDMSDLEKQLEKASTARYRMIATDGAFSMDGTIAPLDQICRLAQRFDALVMVDDCHATGFLGSTGRGSAQHCGVMGQVDVITSTLGKALGGALGGFTSGRQEIIDLLRQRSRPYLFSNALSPVIVKATLAVLDLLEKSTEARDRLTLNTRRFRDGMAAAGFRITPGVHPIVPIMLYNARLSQDMARELFDQGVYVVGFYHPVVGKGLSRIRVQLSAAHSDADIDFALEAFMQAGRKFGVLGKSKEEIIAQYGE